MRVRNDKLTLLHIFTGIKLHRYTVIIIVLFCHNSAVCQYLHNQIILIIILQVVDLEKRRIEMKKAKKRKVKL